MVVVMEESVRLGSNLTNESAVSRSVSIGDKTAVSPQSMMTTQSPSRSSGGVIGGGAGPSLVTLGFSSGTSDPNLSAAPSILPSQEEQQALGASTAAIIANRQRLLQKENLRRVMCPPKLERKHSSGDLHSRLKTRKILGVGETDNGDIHRSKISQVLGHNEHLYVKFPRGVWNWQAFLSLLLLVQALLILFFPRQACQLKLLGIHPQRGNDDGLMMASKYYAVSLLALSFVLWRFMFIRDKGVARTIQLAALIHFSLLCAIDLVSAALTEISNFYDTTLLIVTGVRLGTVMICSIYLRRIGTATSGLRRSPSHKDLGESLKKDG